MVTGKCHKHLRIDGFVVEYDVNKKECPVCELQAELEKHRWIPVSERLPEKRGLYCIYDATEKRHIVFTVTFFDTSDKQFHRRITHWKPIILPDQALNPAGTKGWICRSKRQGKASYHYWRM